MSFTRLFRRDLSCEDVLEVLQSYLDGETDPKIARRVAFHLGRCDLCDHESRIYFQIKVSLAKRRRDLDPDVMAALNQFGRRIAGGQLD